MRDDAQARIGAIAGAAVLFVGLSKVGDLVDGDLKPSPLWLATAAVTTFALWVRHDLRWWAVAGGVVGLVVASVVLYDDWFRPMLSPLLGNALEIVIVVWGVDRVLERRRRIIRTREAMMVLGLIAVAVTAGGLVANLDSSSSVIGSSFASSWWRWSIGDAVGELLLLPLVLTARTPLIRTSRHLVLELILDHALILAVGALALTVNLPLANLICPLVLWLALRFGPRVAVPTSLAVAVTATVLSGAGYGPFVEFGSDPALQVQIFNIALALCAFVGGAHSIRAEEDQKRLYAVLHALPDIVVFRSVDGEVLNTWVPRDRDTDARALVPESSGAAPAVDAAVAVDRVSESTLVATAPDQVFERRVAVAEGERIVEVYRDVSAERRAELELQRRRDAIDDARLDEQRRLGQLLHDSPIQLLTAALLHLRAGLRGDEDAVRRAVEQVTGITEQAVAELRTTMNDLIPPDVATGDLADALGFVARHYLAPEVELDVDDRIERPLPVPVLETLFNVGREALANVAMHAAARRVQISCVAIAGDDVARLVVSDDGVGFVPGERRRRSIGIALMHDRVAALHGRLAVESGDGRGTRVEASVPVAPDSDAGREPAAGRVTTS